MSRRALILDPLWYTLCPSFSHLSISRPALSQRRPQSFKPRAIPTLRLITTPRRCFSENAHRAEDGEISGGESVSQKTRPVPRHGIEVPSHSQEHVENSRDTNLTEEEETEFDGTELRERTTRVPETLEGKSASELETLLQTPKTPTIRGTSQVLRALIRDQHVQPRARHYKALILANIDPVRGSPDAVRGLLSEMEKNGIAADSGTLHAALQVRMLCS